MFDDWYLSNLVCPREHARLRLADGSLQCEHGHRYPIVNGMPVMLVDDAAPTLHVIRGSIRAAKQGLIGVTDELFLETLGVDDDQRAAILENVKKHDLSIDPVVNYLVSHTNGLMYKHLVGKLKAYPIPQITLPPGEEKKLLDIGCSWGRWCIAAARKGYQAVGVDPSLGAVFAAQRVARQLGVNARFIVGDARFLPFPNGTFDTVYSYSVIQHFSIADARLAIQEAGRVLGSAGFCHVQLANCWGLRSFYHQLKRRFRTAEGFEVRYWRPEEMKHVFNDCIGTTELDADCFFGLGLQAADAELMPRWKKLVLVCSEILKTISSRIRPMRLAADSIFVSARKL